MNTSLDTDVAVWTAEAMICLQPWDYWTLEGEPVGRTPEFRAILESAMRRYRSSSGQPSVHPHHGIFPMAGNRRAGRRPTRILTGCGHLVHMASHIWMQTGRYDDAAECNRKAAALDSAWFEGDPLAGEYRFGPQPTLFGLGRLLPRPPTRSRQCRSGDRRRNPPLSSKPWLKTAMACSAKMAMLVRFGLWQEILAEPVPAEWATVSRCLYHYARGVSLPTPAKLIVPAKKWKLSPSPRRHLKKVIHGGWGTNKPMRSCHSPNWCWKAKWNLRLAPRLA